MTLDQCRRFYADEIQYAANLHSPALIEAFARVPRENFLGPGPWQIGVPDVATGKVEYLTTPSADPRHVYHNVTIALDPARNLCNGQPSSLAAWMSALDLQPGNRVFHLGCGVGYFTAIMAEVVGFTGCVIASEVDAGWRPVRDKTWWNIRMSKCTAPMVRRSTPACAMRSLLTQESRILTRNGWSACAKAAA